METVCVIKKRETESKSQHHNNKKKVKAVLQLLQIP